MRIIIPIILIITVGLAIFFLWPTKYEPDDWDSFKEKKPEQKIERKEEKDEEEGEEEEKIETPVLKKKIIDSKKYDFTKQEESEYLDSIRDTIKDQWKELEECENDFDERFGEILKLDPKAQKFYLNNPANMDSFLENVTSFKGTTPSSAQMLKDLAQPIASHVDGNEIMETVGFVKLCRNGEKRFLFSLIRDSLRKDKKAILAALTFLENEAATLTYPRIMVEVIFDLKAVLYNLKIKESAYPEIKKFEISYQDFILEDIKTARDGNSFNPKLQKLAYQHGVGLQKQIQNILKKIKKDLKE